MTLIKPFKAVHYNQEAIGDLSKVVCPPYDVISKEDQARYLSSHPYSFIQILLGLNKSNDDKYDNKYTRAKKLFEDWQKKSILKEDAKPCLYFYKQEYVVRGEKHSRMGFIALMRLQDKGDSEIFPHENTHAHAKEDRLRLWRNIRANCSPIFVCFSDKGKTVERIFLENVSLGQPFINIVDNERVAHKLWRLEDSALIDQIKETLVEQHLFIADGHHRYETAMELRRILLSHKRRANGQEACNFVMTYFTSIDSKDLLILPIHRMVKKIRGKMNFLEEFFRIDRVGNKEDLPILLMKAGQNEHAIGFYNSEGAKLLRLKNKLLIDQYIKEGSREFRSLDAAILKSFILDRIGVKPEDVIYTKDVTEAISLVDTKDIEASFILNPVKIQELKAIALSGERMPPKTTYFYPKVLSGLTVYKINP